MENRSPRQEQPSMENLLKDLRYSLRMAARKPGFTGLVVFSLALGIAANTTIFSVIYGVLLAPPLYRNAERLVVLWESNKAKGITRSPVAPATFRDWSETSRSFQRMELVAPGSPVTVTGAGWPERANIQYASAGLFALLGIRPALGRSFAEKEISSTNPIVLSHGFWLRRFGGDTNVIGQPVTVNGSAYTIIGVLPKDFHLFDRDTDLWMPIDRPGPETQERSFRSWLMAVGRLRSGVTLLSAQAEMNVLAQRIAEAHPETNKDWSVSIEPIQQAQFGYWKPILYLLFGIVTCVLLISCANVASLLLSRLASRNQEFYVRASLGGTRARIVKQLLAEGLALGALGGILGWILAYWGVDLFRAVAPAEFPLLQSIRINLPVLLFCLGTSVLSGVALSISPALLASRVDLQEALKTVDRSTLGMGNRGFRNALVVAEIALSLALLFGAGLMITSSLRLVRVDPGFRAERVVTMQMFLSGPNYFKFGSDGVRIHDEVGVFYSRLLERTSALPGVESAGLVSWLPEMGYNTGRRERAFSIIGRHQDSGSDRPTTAFNMVSTHYFKTLQVPLRKGRDFDSSDDGKSPWVAIVNEAFAERYWPGEDPIGKRLRTEGGSEERPRQIIGVVANVRQESLEKESEPEIFTSFLQQPSVTSGHGYQNRVHMTIVVRAIAEPAATVGAIRKIAAEMDDTQPIYGIRPMPEVLAESTSLRRLYASLLELMAGIALFLSAIGIYSVVSHLVAQRTSEIGLRIAVGATTSDILHLVFTQGGKLIIAGLGVGLALSLTLSRFLTSYLYGIGAADPRTLAAACSVLMVVASAAIWTPARRATRVDPMVALRHE
jgi:putative ABC transport system permease protein